MAEFKLMVCDGCDEEIKISENETDNFYHIKVTAGSWGRQVDLCPHCHTRLLKEIDPGNWMRFSDEKKVA